MHPAHLPNNMPTLRKSLLQLVFSGCYMKRWNDKFRPIELYEVDKQAHKMMVAWLLFELNTEGMDPHERAQIGDSIIEGGIFDYLYRLVITDIKPPVFYEIKANPDHYSRLTDWVVAQLMPRIQTLGHDFCERLATYLSVPEHTDLAGRILGAAHTYASRYEYNLIKPSNLHDDEIADIDAEFEKNIRAASDLRGVDELLIHSAERDNPPLSRFAMLCGQLRFQTRWSQTPRIPETSVLGHMFIVATYAYLFSLELGACPVRKQNNFFTGLFHDLPELLTRDIISPVKRSVDGIADIIREYEDAALKRRVFSLFAADPQNPEGPPHPTYARIAERLGYYLGTGQPSEFITTIKHPGESGIRIVDWTELQTTYNEDRFDPRDGNLLKICDSLAAFIEAYTALRNGINSDALQHSLFRIRQRYQAEPFQYGVHIGAMLADFD